MKIEEVEDRTTCYFTNNQGSLGRPVCVVKFVRITIWGDSFWGTCGIAMVCLHVLYSHKHGTYIQSRFNILYMWMRQKWKSM